MKAPLRVFAVEAQTGPFGSQLHADEYIEDGVPVINPSNIKDGRLIPNRHVTVSKSTSERLAAHRLRQGDLVFARRGELGRSAIVPNDATGWLCGTGSIRVRIDFKKLDPRYAGYALQSEETRGYFSRLAVGSTMENLNTSIVLGTPIPVLPLDVQRRIADFLDAETARMSRLTATLQRFDVDVRERERAVLASMLNAGVTEVRSNLPSGWHWTPLMHLTDQLRQIMYGIVLPGPNVPDGVPIVKGGDVAANRLTAATLNRTTHEIESGYVRSRLTGGDLVIAIRGSVGEVAVVPDELTGANLTQDAARISIGPSTDANWLRLVLDSPIVVHQIQERITGATIKGINIWDLKRVLVPTPRSSHQRSLAEDASKTVAAHEALRTRVTRHRELVAERRQALITAAVTGQFDVSTASGRNVTEGVSV
ncbi:restriction endonuclease subunit S [Streptomyces hilarionis]|uniref:restriction endonuclease subunit S n=1 Tax=Streptomyces hilarionis TaxID=2839954 RepID=UPI00211A20AB|nr:restriction endonuclease subunit S [Streptomyces hilarionis]MCQ9131575.1 restriction endonuclease subunit S [Streptomyces hilarionis]